MGYQNQTRPLDDDDEYPEPEDQPSVIESEILNPEDWEDLSDGEDIWWENWNTSFADGIRFLIDPKTNTISFEEA
jgi:hypothetical protein